MMDVLRQLFERHFGQPATSVSPVQGGLGGSGRLIVRLSSAQHSAIGILNNVREENLAFLSFTRHFLAHGLAVPQIYAEAATGTAYLEEDLGDTTLYQYLTAHRHGPELAPQVLVAYRRVVEELPRFQVEAARGIDYSLCYPRAAFDAQSIHWDLNYFKYYFLKLAGAEFHEQALEEDFARLTSRLLSAGQECFLYRDFQSRNVMLREGRPYFLDYQGGRRGAPHYDIASLLFDAKADLPPTVRDELLGQYLEALARHMKVDRGRFLADYPAWVLVRILQALGAYGYRGFYERKTHFLQSVPYALHNLRWLWQSSGLATELPALAEACAQLTSDAKIAEFRVAASEAGVVGQSAAQSIVAQADSSRSELAKPEDPLTVIVTSFSFHHGPVADESGHGGGYTFDARGLPNPGREARFKSLTGRDAEVATYLEQQSTVAEFLQHALALVEISVAEYRRRGFARLMVSYGCTGGQHRSVYLAEQTARQLRARGVRVELQHREQERWLR
jgi:aminoglycoside/choline kinase family phosphotransferase